MSSNPQTWPDAVSPSSAPPAPQTTTPADRSLRIRLWDLPTRAFHWSLVVVITVSIISGKIGGDWMRVHGIAGLTVIGLLGFRLAWGVIGATHARFTHFVPTPQAVVAYLRGRWRGVGHNPLGALAVLGLLGLLGAQAVTGLFSNDDIAYTGPLISHVSSDVSEWLTGWHRQLSTVMYVAIGVHVLAIVFYALFKKDNLVKPMITGYKHVTHGESTRHGGWLAFLVAVAVGAAAVLIASDAWTETPAAPAPAPAPAAATPAKPPPAPAW